MKNRVLWDFVLGLIFVISLGYLLFFSPTFKIKEIKIVSPPEISAGELEKSLLSELQRSYFYLLKRDTFFLIRNSAIENEILKQFPQVKKATLKKRFPRSLLLEVEQRKAVFIWCYSEFDECFLVDDQGIIFQETQDNTISKESLPLVFFKGQKKEILEEVCPIQEMEQILEIQNVFKEKLALLITHFTKEGEKMLKVKLSGGCEVYFDLTGDIQLALAKLRLLLEKEISPEKIKNLQYIDLRFTKAYYK